jgi:hypothetical protein
VGGWGGFVLRGGWWWGRGDRKCSQLDGKPRVKWCFGQLRSPMAVGSPCGSWVAPWARSCGVVLAARLMQVVTLDFWG